MDNEKIKLEINTKSSILQLFSYPVMIIPNYKNLNYLIKKIQDEKKCDNKGLSIYFLSEAYLNHTEEKTTEELSVIMAQLPMYDFDNPSVIDDDRDVRSFIIYNVFWKNKLKNNKITKQILRDLFKNLATIWNVNVIKDNIYPYPYSSMMLADLKPDVLNYLHIKNLLCYIMRQQYESNIYEDLDEMILDICIKYDFKENKVYDALITLINEGSIFFITKCQSDIVQKNS